MKKIAFAMLSIATLLASCSPKETTLTFIETTDTHGAFDDFASNALFIKQMKNELGDRLILLDNGDNMQGTPFQYCSNHDADNPNLVSEFLNHFPYDAACIGNHDIEAGKAVFDRTYSEAKMPVICANVIDETTGEPYFEPYAMLNRHGYKIAVLGLLTPHVITWVPERLRPGLRFEQLETAAEKWVKIIHEKEKPDLMIGLFHSGWDVVGQEPYEDNPLGRENATKWVAENIPGFDLIFFGHDHRPQTQAVINIKGETVHVLNAGCRAHKLAKAEVSIAKGKKKSIHTEIISIPPQEKDTVFESLVRDYIERAEAYQRQDVAVLPVDIAASDALNGPCLWVDEIHRCQLETVEAQGCKADISFAAPLSFDKRLKAGPLSVKDFFTWYPFENALVVMAMTGQEVKDFLEYAYEMKDPIYNFDSGAGILYEVDGQAERGKRINIISMADGIPFDLEKTYHVVMNSYRSMGGGKHLMTGCGWQLHEINSHVVWQSDRDLRSIFIDWARKKGTLDSLTIGNWHIK